MSKYDKLKTRQPIALRATIDYAAKSYRRSIRITYPAEAEEIISKPTKWKVIYRDEICKVLTANATRETSFTMQGESVFMLSMKDGRKMRIYKDELCDKRAKKINNAIWKELYPNWNHKNRPPMYNV